jgi:tricarballylate dehydrogenase
MMSESSYDVIVVGSGMAGLCAGIRASELGQSVAILEKSPKKRAGGQTRFSESFRVPSGETDISEHGYEFAHADYTSDEFYDDIMDRTNGEADPDLARALVDEAPETIEWLTEHGVDWQMEPLATGYTVGRTWMDGEETVPHLISIAEELGADVYYNAEARDIEQDDDGRVTAINVALADELVTFECLTLILASGGFESNPAKRAQYMGAGYDDMKVRGSRYNTGEAIDMTLDVGALAAGQWSGAHMALIDANSPDVEGGANRVDGYQFGLLLNLDGERFVDEGEDARAHTYAKFGRRIFEQPNHRAYIVLDSQAHDLVRATGPSDPFTADSIESLLSELDIDDETAMETVEAYNEACDPDEFQPEVLDGNDATDISPQKSNWAIGLAEPPYYAYPVTGGITFSFGGVAINTEAEVLDRRERVIPGLYAAGNSTGGLFFNNYPGGTGLMNAAVYGKIAAENAAEYVAD